MNVVLVQGILSRAAQRRELPSGSTVVAYEVTTRDRDGRASTVPVSWPEAPPSAELDEGEEVVVTGAVQRRYFRAGGSTQSRTEVVATAVVATRDRRRARRVLEAARRAIEG
jgi:single-strand DNA-binding protein